MLLNRARGLQALHCIFQAAVAVLAFWGWSVAFFRLFAKTPAEGSLYYYFDYGLLVGCGVMVDYLRKAKYRTDFLNLTFVENFRVSLRQTATVLCVLLAFLVAFHDQRISRALLFGFVPILTLLMFLTNRLFPLNLARWLFSGSYAQNTILLGSRRGVERLSKWLAPKAHYGVKLVGVVTDGAPGVGASSLPELGPIAQLEEHIRRVNATQVIAVDVPHSPVVFNHLANTCQRQGVRLMIANDFGLMVGRRISMVEEDGIHFISFLREPLESPFNRTLKRLLDILISLLVVILILPPMSVLIWIFQRFQAPGPLFFCQTRTGMKGQDFTMYKFRTMFTNNPDEARQASAHDERIFQMGRWLRKLSMDEMPQFYNVLKGEMSVVGPRPHMREHDELFRQKMMSYGVRSFIKPGITGLSQVRDLRGQIRSDKDVIERVRTDIDYMENWSILLDIEIIARTAVKLLFPPKTAH